MSQKAEKYARSMERRMTELEDRFFAAVHTNQLRDATDYAAANRKARGRARQAENTARKWRCCTWLAVIALMLCAALCLTIKAKAQPELPVVVDELVEPEDFENQKIETALLAKANVIEGCTVTWYTADTGDKKPGDPAYGITRSGMPVVEHLTCAVDPDVIPLYSDVFVQYVDGTIEQLWATDTGVRGNSLDIYTPDYDYAIQCGRQSLTVWWVET
ncbi:hypothetical protein QVN85_06775 [Oscillibacter valericigenes]|uniref:3D domain-containing protein n=1 Tax=Oscillibacter ruminantium TaxID=1263547 RepID=UPI0025AAF721|nr:hypothetical protein [Oscillibacter valericigenes]